MGGFSAGHAGSARASSQWYRSEGVSSTDGTKIIPKCQLGAMVSKQVCSPVCVVHLLFCLSRCASLALLPVFALGCYFGYNSCVVVLAIYFQFFWDSPKKNSSPELSDLEIS